MMVYAEKQCCKVPSTSINVLHSLMLVTTMRAKARKLRPGDSVQAAIANYTIIADDE